MKKGVITILTKTELLNVTGGDGFSIGAIVGGAVAFIIGALDGFFRPLKCR